MSENKIDKGRIQAATSRNNKSRLLGTGIIASMLILSIVVLSTMQGQLSSKVAYAQATPFSDTFKKVTENFQTFPQPNANNTLITGNASKALFEPAAGLSNVFGPARLFPFKDTFNCANALTCGVSAGNNSKFIGIFDQGNKHNMTGYEATYTSPVTYGPEQIKGHTYKITLTDTQWNSPDAAKPTRQAEFAQMVNNVGFNQIQHGASHVDRSDVPQLFDNAFLYGHAKVTDTTNGNNTVVAKDIFTHVMVAHVMNENTYYRSLKDSAQSPTLVFLFAINIPSDVALPGVGKLTPDKAQSFTPLSTDVSMKNLPQFTYSVKVPAPRSGSIKAPDSQSTTWPVDNPKQPLLFTFLVYQKVK